MNSDNEVRVYGYSDDLIEIDGAFEAEIGCWNAEGSRCSLRFDDGTVLDWRYDGVWKVEVPFQGTADVSIEPVDGPESVFYSDVVTLRGVSRLVSKRRP